MAVACLGSCQCGKKKNSRIVGGQETEVNEYPWMVALQNGGETFDSQICGGTLVAANWVITAAHCFFDPDTGERTLFEADASVLIGEHDFGSTSEDTIKKNIAVEKMIWHPQYDRVTVENDIALLKLSESVDLNVYSPACMPTSDADFTGKSAWVYGWGSTVAAALNERPPPDTTSEKLLELQVKIVSDADCRIKMEK